MSFLRRLAGRPDSASAASDAVTQLRTHPALRRLRPLPPRPTFADWQRLSSEERSALYEPQIDAIRSLSREEQDELRRLIRAAGQSRDPSAVPVLANGAINGFRLDYIAPTSFYEKIGLRYGDILKQVNGVEIKDPGTMLSLFQQLRNEKSVKLDILRNNQRTTMMFDIR